jgi:hypothetical protein
MKITCLIALLAISCPFHPTIARAPSSVSTELCRSRKLKIITRHEKLPGNVRAALAQAFQQQRLFMANPGEVFQQTDVLVIKPGRKELPTRRLLFAFGTETHFVVYYESVSAGLGANALIFLVQGGVATLAWGGVEVDHDKLAKNPGELLSRICAGQLISDRAFLW